MNRVKFFSIFCVFFFSHSSYAQLTFQKTYGGTSWDSYYDMIKVSGLGPSKYLLAGYTLSYVPIVNGGYSADSYLIMVDEFGDVLWSTAFGGGGIDQGNSVTQTPDGGFILAGETNSFGSGMIDLYITKLNSNGSLQWSRTVGNSNNEGCNSVLATHDSCVVILGSSWGIGSGNNDIYLVKMDLSGNLLWTKSYGKGASEIGMEIISTSDSGFAILGNTSSQDICLIKTDSDGNIMWDMIFASNPGSDGAFSICEANDGGFLIAGQYANPSGSHSDVGIIRTNSIGNVLWSNYYGSSSLSDFGTSIGLNTKGEILCAGYTESFGQGLGDLFLMNLDVNGNVLWSYVYGGQMLDGDLRSKVYGTTDGGYIIGSNSRSWPWNDAGLYLVKTDSYGKSDCNESLASFQAKTYSITAYSANFATDKGGKILTPQDSSRSGHKQIDHCTTAGVNGSSELIDNLIVFPSVTTGVINVINSSKGEMLFNLYSIMGEKVLRLNSEETQVVVDISDFPSGIYFLTADFIGRRLVAKIIKQ